VVKSIQDGVPHYITGALEAMPLALQVDGQIQRWIGQAGPQGRACGRPRL
jgi:hypothetical protein